MEIRFENVEELIELIEKNEDEISTSRELKLICTSEQHCSNIDFNKYNLDFEKIFRRIREVRLNNCTVILSDIDKGTTCFAREPKISFNNCNINRLENISYDGYYKSISVEDSNIDFSEMDINEEEFFQDMFAGGRPKIHNSTYKCKESEYEELLSVMLEDANTEIEYSKLAEFDRLLGFSENTFFDEVKGKKKIIINAREELEELLDTGEISEINWKNLKLSEKLIAEGFDRISEGSQEDRKRLIGMMFLDSLGYNVKNENNQLVFTISDASKLSIEDIEEFEKQGIKIDKVFIKPEKDATDNSKRCDYKYSHTSYTVEEYKKCRKVIDEILANVDEREKDGSNEVDIFMQIYTKLAYMIEYNYQAIGANGEIAEKTKNSNLIGALLRGKTICAGYAETLRNVLACRNIESLCIGSKECMWLGHLAGHAYNQVKLNGKWYCTDLTIDRDSLMEGKGFDYCLVSQEDFEKGLDDELRPAHIPIPDWKSENATESYQREDVQKLYDENKSRIFDEHRKEIEHKIDRLFEGLAMYNRKLDRQELKSLKEKFWDKGSSDFEQGMLKIGKQLGWIKDDAAYGDEMQYKFIDRYESVILMNKLGGAFTIRENRKIKLKEWYEKLGLKTSDLEPLMRMDSVELQESKDKENRER